MSWPYGQLRWGTPLPIVLKPPRGAAPFWVVRLAFLYSWLRCYILIYSAHELCDYYAYSPAIGSCCCGSTWLSYTGSSYTGTYSGTVAPPFAPLFTSPKRHNGLLAPKLLLLPKPNWSTGSGSGASMTWGVVAAPLCQSNSSSLDILKSIIKISLFWDGQIPT